MNVIYSSNVTFSTIHQRRKAYRLFKAIQRINIEKMKVSDKCSYSQPIQHVHVSSHSCACKLTFIIHDTCACNTCIAIIFNMKKVCLF